MASIDGKLPNTRADLHNLAVNSNWLDYTTCQVLIYSIRAMKQLLIGARFSDFMNEIVELFMRSKVQ